MSCIVSQVVILAELLISPKHVKVKTTQTALDHGLCVCGVSAFKFQENLLKTMLQIENTFRDLSSACFKNCLVICDRGAMDASACKLLILGLYGWK
jgi:hypothetical protein